MSKTADGIDALLSCRLTIDRSLVNCGGSVTRGGGKPSDGLAHSSWTRVSPEM